MDERRGGSRVRTFLRGRIVYNNRATTVDCLVRDLSGSGARLALSKGVALPEVFDLTIPHRETSYRCTLRWQRPGEVGVVFATPAAAAAPRPAAADPATIDLLLRVRQLELENESLRHRIAELTVRVPESA